MVSTCDWEVGRAVDFDWDPNKAKTNLAKHDVAFEEAEVVFADRYALIEDDGSSVFPPARFFSSSTPKLKTMSFASSRPGRPLGMSKIATTGKRHLKDDVWHDDNGPIGGTPRDWEPPMTDDEVEIAALSDPDAQPMTEAQLSKMRRVSFAKHVRWKLGLSQPAFAARFQIPLGTLRDWEQHRTEPDAAALAYLQVIANEPEAVNRALEKALA